MNNYIIEKLKQTLELSKKLEGFDPVITGIGVTLRFDYVEMKNGGITIITGNKEFPHGISVSKSEYTLVVLGEFAWIIDTKLLKDFIRSNWQSIKKTTSEDYKHIGVVLTEDDIVKLGNLTGGSSCVKLTS